MKIFKTLDNNKLTKSIKNKNLIIRTNIVLIFFQIEQNKKSLIRDKLMSKKYHFYKNNVL